VKDGIGSTFSCIFTLHIVARNMHISGKHCRSRMHGDVTHRCARPSHHRPRLLGAAFHAINPTPTPAARPSQPDRDGEDVQHVQPTD